jgi:hypothetical protein
VKPVPPTQYEPDGHVVLSTDVSVTFRYCPGFNVYSFNVHVAIVFAVALLSDTPNTSTVHVPAPPVIFLSVFGTMSSANADAINPTNNTVVKNKFFFMCAFSLVFSVCIGVLQKQNHRLKQWSGGSKQSDELCAYSIYLAALLTIWVRRLFAIYNMKYVMFMRI